MKVIDKFKEAKETLFSFEIIPPIKGTTIDQLFSAIDPLMEFNPAFIDVTYHRQEYVYNKLPNGLMEKKFVRKRPGTVGICAAIMNKYKVEAVPHLICGGFTRAETEDALIDLHFLGVENVLVLRGDAIKADGKFIPEERGHNYASELLEQVVNLNKGKYLDEDLGNESATDFCISIAGYPEKHFEAPNMKTDMDYLKMKVDMGAEYIVTQMFFDNQKFFEFVDSCREYGINVPIVPGLKPLATKKQLTLLPSIFHIDMPQDLVTEASKCTDNNQVKELGIEWCIQQSKELKEYGVPSLHYYSMGRSYSTSKIAEAVF